jgi:hypothetical protein
MNEFFCFTLKSCTLLVDDIASHFFYCQVVLQITIIDNTLKLHETYDSLIKFSQEVYLLLFRVLHFNMISFNNSLNPAAKSQLQDF